MGYVHTEKLALYCEDTSCKANPPEIVEAPSLMK